MSGSVAAQDYIEYSNQADRFIVNFPGQPKVTETTYETEFGLALPAHVHTAEAGRSRYSVTVIDYNDVQKIHAERLKGCQAYPNLCGNPWVGELRGALDYAASRYITRDGKVTYYAYANSDRIEGRRVQLTNPDGSRTFVAIYMHENRLYILDGTVPAGAIPPALFQQSMGFFDKDGVRVRYASPYSNMYPAPPREPGSGRFAGC
jgi:hypothetical protein